MGITQEQLDQYFDAEVVDQDGERVGSLGEVYVDNRTGHPAWATVRTGWFAGRKVFVPLATAELRDGRVLVPYSTEMIKRAPDIAPDGHLSEDNEQDLYLYYAVDDGPAPSA
ncbi:PRC-barrel domain-containing protein [Ornithinimicrobium panacihumi]|uniref:PRC-barrel domain-containing protein n=1 Tax=Ornithinimicrobium panacihumi TaxID=2008449 RepID=UPI003F8C9597